MSDSVLRMYHRLPAPVRSLAATVRGSRLRSWRYGEDTDRLVAEALERDYWEAAQWQDWQRKNLKVLLHRAATRVPFYRDLWLGRRRHGDQRSWEHLENWPILEKEELRQDPNAFVADDCDLRRMKHVHTSGTTGKSLDLWRSRTTERAWYALFEARCRSWYGVSRRDRWAILGGQLVTAVSNRKPPFWVWNAALNQLYMSSYHLSPDLLAHYVEAIRRHQITYLYGYSSSLYEVALEVLKQGATDLKMRVALTNAEPLFDYQREAIEKAFQCPVRETYGMAEIVTAASECEHGQLHLWPDVGVTENLIAEDEDGGGLVGDLVCTGLLNPDMPLIRYRVGDRATLSTTAVGCACGRTLPLLTSVEGRSDDVVFTSDGRRIGRLDPVFKSNLAVREAQIVQESLERLRVRYVPTSDFNQATADSMIKRLKEYLGNFDFVLEAVAEVPRTANGKFRAVVCQLPAESRKSPGTEHYHI